MDILQILKLAYQAEARATPTVVIFDGSTKITYAEFAEMLERNEVPPLVKSFLKNAVRMYNESEVYRSRMMKLAGVDVE